MRVRGREKSRQLREPRQNWGIGGPWRLRLGRISNEQGGTRTPDLRFLDRRSTYGPDRLPLRLGQEGLWHLSATELPALWPFTKPRDAGCGSRWFPEPRGFIPDGHSNSPPGQLLRVGRVPLSQQSFNGPGGSRTRVSTRFKKNHHRLLHRFNLDSRTT